MDDETETSKTQTETFQKDTMTGEDNVSVDENEMNTNNNNNNRTLESFHNENYHGNQFVEKLKNEFLIGNSEFEKYYSHTIEKDSYPENFEKIFSIQKTDDIRQQTPLNKNEPSNYDSGTVSYKNEKQNLNKEPYSNNDSASHDASLDVVQLEEAHRREEQERYNENLRAESSNHICEEFVGLTEDQTLKNENHKLFDKTDVETDHKGILQNNSSQNSDKLFVENITAVVKESENKKCINDGVVIRKRDNDNDHHPNNKESNNEDESCLKAEKNLENCELVFEKQNLSSEKSEENFKKVNTVAKIGLAQTSSTHMNHFSLDQTRLSDSFSVTSSSSSDNLSYTTNTFFSQSLMENISNQETSVSTVNTLAITCCISTSTIATTTFFLTTFSTTTLSTGSSLHSPFSNTTEFLSTQVLTFPTSTLSTTSTTSSINSLKGKSLIPIRKHFLSSFISTSNTTTITSSKPTTKSVTVTLIPMPKTRRLSKETTLSSILKKYSSYNSEEHNDFKNTLSPLKSDAESNDKTIVYSNTTYEINRETDLNEKNIDVVNNQNVVEQTQLTKYNSKNLNPNSRNLTRSRNSQNLNLCLTIPSNNNADYNDFKKKLNTYQPNQNEIGTSIINKEQNNVFRTRSLDNKHRRKNDNGSMIPALKPSFFYDKNQLDEAKNKLKIYFLKSKIPTLTKSMKDQIFRNNQMNGDSSNTCDPKNSKAKLKNTQSKGKQSTKSITENGNKKNKSSLIGKNYAKKSKKLEGTNSADEYEESNTNFNTGIEDRKLSASSESSSTSSCYDDASNELSNLINHENNKKLIKNKNSKRSSNRSYMNNSLTSGYVSDDDNEVYHITRSIPKNDDCLKNKRKISRSASVDGKKKTKNSKDAGIGYVRENIERLETFEDWQNKMQSFREEFKESTNSLSTSSSSTGCWTDFDKIPFKDDESLPIEEIPVVNRKLERLFEVYKKIENRKKEKAEKIIKNLSKKEFLTKPSKPKNFHTLNQNNKPFVKTQIQNLISNKLNSTIKSKVTIPKTKPRISDPPKPPMNETRQRLKEYNDLFKQRQKRLFDSFKANRTEFKNSGSQYTSNEFSKNKTINTKSKLKSLKPLKSFVSELKNESQRNNSSIKLKSKNYFKTNQQPLSPPVVINKMINFHSPRIRSLESQKRLNDIMEIGNQLKGITKLNKTLKDAKYSAKNTLVSKPRNYREQIDNNRQVNFEKQLKSKINKSYYASNTEVRPAKSKNLSGHGSMSLVGTTSFKNSQLITHDKKHVKFPNVYSSIKYRNFSNLSKKIENEKKIEDIKEKTQKNSKLSDKKQLIRPPWKYFTRA